MHHLRVLERNGRILARRSMGYTCYFPAGARPAVAAAAAKADGARAVLEALRAQPGLSGQEIAARTGLQPSTVSYHAQRLGDAGLLRPMRDGRAVRYHPVDGPQAA